MAIQIRDNKLHIDKVVIDNELVVEYVNKLPQAERDKAIEEALGIGIMAALGVTSIIFFTAQKGN